MLDCGLTSPPRHFFHLFVVNWSYLGIHCAKARSLVAEKAGKLPPKAATLC